MTAAVQGGHAPGHIHSIVQAIKPAVKLAKEMPGDLLDNAVRTNVKLVVNKLKKSKPILSELVDAGKIRVIGARYDLNTGAVEFF